MEWLAVATAWHPGTDGTGRCGVPGVDEYEDRRFGVKRTQALGLLV